MANPALFISGFKNYYYQYIYICIFSVMLGACVLPSGRYASVAIFVLARAKAVKYVFSECCERAHYKAGQVSIHIPSAFWLYFLTVLFDCFHDRFCLEFCFNFYQCTNPHPFCAQPDWLPARGRRAHCLV
jgi:hypothetical protein